MSIPSLRQEFPDGRDQPSSPPHDPGHDRPQPVPGDAAILHQGGFKVQPPFRPLAGQADPGRCPRLPGPSRLDRHLVAQPEPDVCALRFFYGVTLGDATLPERIPHGRGPGKLPVVLSADEIVHFLEAVSSPAADFATPVGVVALLSSAFARRSRATLLATTRSRSSTRTAGSPRGRCASPTRPPGSSRHRCTPAPSAPVGLPEPCSESSRNPARITSGRSILQARDADERTPPAPELRRRPLSRVIGASAHARELSRTGQGGRHGEQCELHP